MKKKFLLCSALCALLFASAHDARAIALTIGDAYELGFVDYGIPAGDANRTSYVNVLVGMALGTTFDDTAGATGQFYTRSNNDFGSLAAAVFNSNGSGTSVDLGTGGFLYLLAKYDGPNYGSEVWYVGGLSGVITIPANPPGGGNGLSGWTLFTGGSTVPEGGATSMLLGVSLGALELLRRKLRKLSPTT